MNSSINWWLWSFRATWAPKTRPPGRGPASLRACRVPYPHDPTGATSAASQTHACRPVNGAPAFSETSGKHLGRMHNRQHLLVSEPLSDANGRVCKSCMDWCPLGRELDKDALRVTQLVLLQAGEPVRKHLRQHRNHQSRQINAGSPQCASRSSADPVETKAATSAIWTPNTNVHFLRVTAKWRRRNPAHHRVDGDDGQCG